MERQRPWWTTRSVQALRALSYARAASSRGWQTSLIAEDHLEPPFGPDSACSCRLTRACSGGRLRRIRAGQLYQR